VEVNVNCIKLSLGSSFTKTSDLFCSILSKNLYTDFIKHLNVKFYNLHPSEAELFVAARQTDG
jgi:hypothetical protein